MPKLLLKFNAAVIKEIPIEKDEVTIGRKPDNDVVVDNPAVSGRHARIVRQAGSWVLEDLNSTNGTFMQERRILKANLHHKDEVGVAKHVIVFINEEEAAAPPPVPSVPVSSDATVVMAPPAAAEAKPDKKTSEVLGGLRVVTGESSATQFSLTGLTTYIGKSDQAAVRTRGFFAPDLSACVARKPEGYYLKVIKEKSVKVNGQTVEDQVLLKEGDLIEAANLKLVFYHQDASGPVSG